MKKKDHIKKLITFKVDYYVGKIKGAFSWAKLNDTSQKLTPYNYDQLIDKAETNKVFIKRMLRKCTYFQNENCMQQETILYQLYIFYNTINKLKINSIPISTEQKNSVFDCLVEGGELTERKLRNILKISNDDIISGVNLDNNLNHLSLSAIKKFKSVFDENTSACDSKYSLFFDDFVNACALIDKKK